MILADLRNYLQEKQRIPLNDLVVHFKIDPEALRGMLGKWMQKGKVRLISGGSAGCGASCCKCDPLLTEIYEWVDDSSR